MWNKIRQPYPMLMTTLCISLKEAAYTENAVPRLKLCHSRGSTPPLPPPLPPPLEEIQSLGPWSRGILPAITPLQWCSEKFIEQTFLPTHDKRTLHSQERRSAEAICALSTLLILSGKYLNSFRQKKESNDGPLLLPCIEAAIMSLRSPCKLYPWLFLR